jgi:membrane protease YdiL (CAAX protease family)
VDPAASERRLGACRHRFRQRSRSGIGLVSVVALIERIAPTTLPEALHPPTFLVALLASAAASFGEEILCRLFLLGALPRIFSASIPSTAAVRAAIAVSSILFGALHAPSAMIVWGGFAEVPPLF